ncbi:unnamed protein product, partial [Sphacelaria rigidula]
TVKLAAGTWDSGVFRSSGDGGRARDATMAYPKGIAVDESNTFYVTEFYGARVRAVTTAVEIFTCAGTGSQNYSGDGSIASDATVSMPSAVAFSPVKGGKMAIADFGNNDVRVVTPSCL